MQPILTSSQQSQYCLSGYFLIQDPTTGPVFSLVIVALSSPFTWNCPTALFEVSHHYCLFRIQARGLVGGPHLFGRDTVFKRALPLQFLCNTKDSPSPFCLRLWDFGRHPMHGWFNSDSSVKNGFEAPISSLHIFLINCGCQLQGSPH